MCTLASECFKKDWPLCEHLNNPKSLGLNCVHGPRYQTLCSVCWSDTAAIVTSHSCPINVGVLLRHNKCPHAAAPSARHGHGFSFDYFMDVMSNGMYQDNYDQLIAKLRYRMRRCYTTCVRNVPGVTA